MRVRTSLPRSIRPRETRMSAQVRDAKEGPCSWRRHGRRETGPPGRRPPNAPFRPRSPQSFSEDPASTRFTCRPTSSESSVSTLRLRTRVKRGPQSRSAGLALSDTLPSEDRWRSGTAPTSSPSCVRMRRSERGWWSSHSERRKGRRRSGGSGRSRSFGGSSMWRSTSATRTRPDSAFPTGT